MGEGARWVVMPDCVGDASRTLEMAAEWWPLLDNYPVLLAVQDGIAAADVAIWLERGAAGLFVGGSTAWKLRTLSQWAAMARSYGKICHVGRVNSIRRIRQCVDAGVHSVDGTSATRFSCNAQKLSSGLHQESLLRRLLL